MDLAILGPRLNCIKDCFDRRILTHFPPQLRETQYKKEQRP